MELPELPLFLLTEIAFVSLNLQQISLLGEIKFKSTQEISTVCNKQWHAFTAPKLHSYDIAMHWVILWNTVHFMLLCNKNMHVGF